MIILKNILNYILKNYRKIFLLIILLFYMILLGPMININIILGMIIMTLLFSIIIIDFIK